MALVHKMGYMGWMVAYSGLDWAFSISRLAFGGWRVEITGMSTDPAAWHWVAFALSIAYEIQEVHIAKKGRKYKNISIRCFA